MQGNVKFVVAGMFTFSLTYYFLNSTHVPDQITLPFLFLGDSYFLSFSIPILYSYCG
jgi:hypothetical protein